MSVVQALVDLHNNPRRIFQTYREDRRAGLPIILWVIAVGALLSVLLAVPVSGWRGAPDSLKALFGVFLASLIETPVIIFLAKRRRALVRFDAFLLIVFVVNVLMEVGLALQELLSSTTGEVIGFLVLTYWLYWGYKVAVSGISEIGQLEWRQARGVVLNFAGLVILLRILWGIYWFWGVLMPSIRSGIR